MRDLGASLLGLIYPRPEPLRPNLSHICAPSPILILWDYGKGMVLLKMISRLHRHKIIPSIQELHWVMKVLRPINSTNWMAYTKVEPKWKRTHFLFNQFHHRGLSDFKVFNSDDDISHGAFEFFIVGAGPSASIFLHFLPNWVSIKLDWA